MSSLGPSWRHLRPSSVTQRPAKRPFQAQGEGVGGGVNPSPKGTKGVEDREGSLNHSRPKGWWDFYIVFWPLRALQRCVCVCMVKATLAFLGPTSPCCDDVSGETAPSGPAKAPRVKQNGFPILPTVYLRSSPETNELSICRGLAGRCRTVGERAWLRTVHLSGHPPSPSHRKNCAPHMVELHCPRRAHRTSHNFLQ